MQVWEGPSSPKTYLYCPYFIVPRENDLQKISVRTLSECGHSRIELNGMEEFNLPSFGPTVQFTRTSKTVSNIGDLKPVKEQFNGFHSSSSSCSEYLPQDIPFHDSRGGAGV
jgi:hypothetical protein